jgi:hypothetical protein
MQCMAYREGVCLRVACIESIHSKTDILGRTPGRLLSSLPHYTFCSLLLLL